MLGVWRSNTHCAVQNAQVVPHLQTDWYMHVVLACVKSKWASVHGLDNLEVLKQPSLQHDSDHTSAD